MARSGRRGARGGGSRKTTRSGRHVMVVESPVKARTIGGYLGREYRVIATRGHVRDLPAKAGSVKPEDGFAMLTETGRRAARTLAAVANALANAETLVLATDPDREGEAIAWQVLSWLAERGAIGEKPVHRVAFHEVTPAAVRTALARPRDIDMDLVRAWQARRALDYPVGYGLSPILWRKLPGCRSAGRVQSVALRLVCEREAEIEAFVPRQSWTVHAELAAADGVPFPATLCRLDGSAVGEEGLAMEELAQETAKRIGESRLAVLSVERDTLRRRPLPPFTTSTLQQEALQRLGFGIGETMDIAQRLYEACIVIARHYEIHVPFFSAIPEPHLPRMSGPLGNPTYLSVCMLFNLLLALGFAVRAWLPGTEPALATALPVPARRGGQGRRRREAPATPDVRRRPRWPAALAWTAAAALLFWGLALAGSVGGFAGLFAAVAFVAVAGALLGRGRTRRVALAATVLFCVAAVVMGLRFFEAERTALRGIDHPVAGYVAGVHLQRPGVQSRLAAWEAGIEGFAARPVLGWGPENFTAVFGRFASGYGAVAEPHDQAHGKLVEVAASLETDRFEAVAQAMNLYPDYFTFSFVRNPYRRFVSLWLSTFWNRDPRLPELREGLAACSSMREFAELSLGALRAFAGPAAPLRSSCPEAWGGSQQPSDGGVRAAGVRRGSGRSGRHGRRWPGRCRSAPAALRHTRRRCASACRPRSCRRRS